MIHSRDRYDYYIQLKALLHKEGFTVNPYREIQYGLQFMVFLGEESALLRIYESKKGVRLDFSQAKSELIYQKISFLIDEQPVYAPQGPPVSDLFLEEDQTGLSPDIDPTTLIGVDESGKGDYFGPLVIAAVYTTPEISLKLLELGVKDSKKLSDATVYRIAPAIMSLCTHCIIQMGNESYNLVYHKLQNLNHLLAWGHAKSIEGVLKQVSCENALSDQFAHASLVKNALRSRGIRIHLFQRHRAEDNVAVAAASILARYSFLTYMDMISSHYQFKFLKGASESVLKAAVSFAETYSFDELRLVAKLHFKTTESVKQALEKG